MESNDINGCGSICVHCKDYTVEQQTYNLWPSRAWEIYSIKGGHPFHPIRSCYKTNDQMN